MRTLAIIPSRYSSSRFPGKPLADICGKCMIQLVYEQSKKAFKNVCVATDDERIYNKVKEFDGEVIMTSVSHKSGTDRCYEAYIKYCKLYPEKSFDLVMNIQGDEPLIDPDQLLSLENAFMDKNVKIGTMAKEITSYSELFCKNTPKLVVDKAGFALYFSRSTIPYLRDINEADWKSYFHFLKHIGLYAYRPEVLEQICEMEQTSLEIAENLEQLRWLENGLKIKVILTKCNSFSIDTPIDLERLIEYLRKNCKK